MIRLWIQLLTAAFAAALTVTTSASADQMIGINVVLNQPMSESILAELGAHGEVLDVFPQLNGVTLKAHASELPAIQAMYCVAGANPDEECQLGSASGEGLPVPDFADGASHWGLDAINVTEFEVGRVLDYDGAGVYVAVVDTGLPQNWRAYFPEERIATQFARAFGGGGGEHGTVSEQPDKWAHDTNGHGAFITSVILGFHYAGPGEVPPYLNGVAPKATVIPIKMYTNGNGGGWFSVATHSLVYLTDLKNSGALGDAPLVINFSSWSIESDVLMQAAIDYAIANGVIFVSIAGNDGDAGMRFPGVLPEVISAGHVGWVSEFPPDDPTIIEWVLRDVPEADLTQYFIAPDSGRELPGQDLDVVAPGWMIPLPWTVNGQVDYTFGEGTSIAAPYVAGIAALMLQKNPALTQAQIEGILESTAVTVPAGCRDTTFPGLGPGNPTTLDDFSNLFFFDTTVCWDVNATGAGLVQADAALAATPSP